jgi:hypothetical protein
MPSLYFLSSSSSFFIFIFCVKAYKSYCNKKIEEEEEEIEQGKNIITFPWKNKQILCLRFVL